MSYLYSVNKTGVGGFFKNSVSKWRSRRLSLFWWGLGLVALKKKSLLSRIFCWGFLFVLFIFLESSTATCETMELKKPRDLNQLIVLFVNLYK